MIVLLVVTLLSASTISAKNDNANDNEKRAEARLNAINKGICNARQRKSANLFRFWTKQQDRTIANYQRKITRFESWATQYEKNGGNTTELKTDIETLKAKLATLRSDIESLKSKANEYKNIDCADKANSDAKYKEITDLVKKIRADRKDFEAFIRSDINPDLKTLKVTPTPTVTPTP